MSSEWYNAEFSYFKVWFPADNRGMSGWNNPAMCAEYCGGHHPVLHGWDCLCQAVKTKEQDKDCGVFQVSTFPAKTRHGLVW